MPPSPPPKCGRKLSENIWLHADLTKDEREAKYKLRVQKREKAK